MRFLGVAALLCAASVPALAQEDAPEEKPITGTYYVGPAMDAEDPKAPADHIYMTLTGAVAKSMWDAIPGAEQPDECVGRMAKWSKSLACYGPPSPQSGGALAPGDSPYECYMGIDLKAGALYLGQDC
jgi:hypothetical protein